MGEGARRWGRAHGREFVCAVGMTQALRLAGLPHIWRCPLPHLEVERPPGSCRGGAGCLRWAGQRQQEEKCLGVPLGCPAPPPAPLGLLFLGFRAGPRGLSRGL